MLPSPAALLELSGVSKHFGGARALDAVDLRIDAGEIHGLLGQNGSGKSTLLKVLSGFHDPDGGRLTVRGEDVALPLSPGAFRDLGFAFVHQDLALVPGLSVTENLIVSRLAGRAGARIHWRRENRRAAEVLASYGLTGIDPAAPISRLTQMQRALVAVVRAVEELRADGHDSVLLVLDEPTAFLPRAGVEHLFALVREVVGAGGSALFVTHDLDEVVELCDRVTVLRDGRSAGTVEVAGTTTDELVELIIGRRLESRQPAERAAVRSASTGLRARNVTGAVVHDVDFEVASGEVLGLTGLLGSGFEELLQVVYGARPGQGTIELEAGARDIARLTPAAAMGLGMAFVPADRPAEAAIASLSVADNVTMPTLERHRGPLGLSRARVRESAADLGRRYDVRPNRPELPLSALSGGNQQKAVMGKWLQTEPRVLLLDQPTQGVDVGAREQIFAAIRAAAASGTAVVCASADAEELAAVCDRVLVLARGALIGEITGAELTKERIAERVLTSTTTADAVSTTT
jgi:ribose transport system ATP-binding protein